MKLTPLCNRVLLSTVFFLFCSATFAQNTGFNTIKLQPIENSDVIFHVAPSVSIQFSKKDFIADYNDFKSNFIFIKGMSVDTVSMAKAIDYLKKSKSPIILRGNEDPRNEDEKILQGLIHDRIGCSLLYGGKARVTRNGNPVDAVMVKSVRSPSDKTPFAVYFTDKTVCYVGEMAGLPQVGTVEVEATSEVIFEEPSEETKEGGDPNRVFVVVEIQPTPVGGMTPYYEYLKKDQKYPKKSKAAKMEGTVFVGFVVESDGSLTSFEILKGVDPNIDKEAIRLIKAGPKWVPGKQSGKVVRSKYVLPVKIKLADAGK